MLNNAGKTLLLFVYKICFYNARLIGSNNGPFTRNAITRKNSAFDNVDFLRKLLDTWISW